MYVGNKLINDSIKRYFNFYWAIYITFLLWPCNLMTSLFSLIFFILLELTLLINESFWLILFSNILHKIFFHLYWFWVCGCGHIFVLHWLHKKKQKTLFFLLCTGIVGILWTLKFWRNLSLKLFGSGILPSQGPGIHLGRWGRFFFSILSPIQI